MKPQFELHKKQIKLALNWLEIIEDCEWHINHGFKPDYYTGVRQEAIDNYIEAMSNIVQSAIEIESIQHQKPKDLNEFLFKNLSVVTDEYRRANKIDYNR